MATMMMQRTRVVERPIEREREQHVQSTTVITKCRLVEKLDLTVAIFRSVKERVDGDRHAITVVRTIVEEVERVKETLLEIRVITNEREVQACRERIKYLHETALRARQNVQNAYAQLARDKQSVEKAIRTVQKVKSKAETLVETEPVAEPSTNTHEQFQQQIAHYLAEMLSYPAELEKCLGALAESSALAEKAIAELKELLAESNAKPPSPSPSPVSNGSSERKRVAFATTKAEKSRSSASKRSNEVVLTVGVPISLDSCQKTDSSAKIFIPVTRKFLVSKVDLEPDLESILPQYYRPRPRAVQESAPYELRHKKDSDCWDRIKALAIVAVLSIGLGLLVWWIFTRT